MAAVDEVNLTFYKGLYKGELYTCCFFLANDLVTMYRMQLALFECDHIYHHMEFWGDSSQQGSQTMIAIQGHVVHGLWKYFMEKVGVFSFFRNFMSEPIYYVMIGHQGAVLDVALDALPPHLFGEDGEVRIRFRRRRQHREARGEEEAEGDSASSSSLSILESEEEEEDVEEEYEYEDEEVEEEEEEEERRRRGEGTDVQRH
jgi:hypothetical protein